MLIHRGYRNNPCSFLGFFKDRDSLIHMELNRISEKSDLIVIWGGITGAGIFREAVRNGLHTLLVEQKDFAWGDSPLIVERYIKGE